MRRNIRTLALTLGIFFLALLSLGSRAMADDGDRDAAIFESDRWTPEVAAAAVSDESEELDDIDRATPERHSHHGHSARSEKVTFLGITTAEPTPALRAQLRLPTGTGLLIDRVLHDSPADKAGLHRFDVMQKFEDQLLIDYRQLSVLVRLHKPGDEVKLAVIREGSPQVIAVKLGETDVETSSRPSHPWPWHGMPGFPWHNWWRTPEGQRFGPWETREDRHARLVPPTTEPSRTSAHTWNEDGNTYVITMRNGHRYITVTRDGQNTFQGLIDNDEQVRKLPSDIREKVEKALRDDHRSSDRQELDTSPSR